MLFRIIVTDVMTPSATNSLTRSRDIIFGVQSSRRSCRRIAAPIPRVSGFDFLQGNSPKRSGLNRYISGVDAPRRRR
ncbi:hypothetical protein EVAR_67041_1 [Eumeta japonica]|uniref:Uncharacterized protein n=1 Tax=Eumeta variegata TaxID=151549 RepID=A0A4C1ZWP3_EUMVA|nr:hypothetical protein EVAR_67041_1 [Eumeta japonica]